MPSRFEQMKSQRKIKQKQRYNKTTNQELVKNQETFPTTEQVCEKNSDKITFNKYPDITREEVEKWVENNVYHLEELSTYQKEEIVDTLYNGIIQEDLGLYQDCPECLELMENKYFCYEIYLGRSPQTDMRTYEYIGSKMYVGYGEYKEDTVRIWNYSETLEELEDIIIEIRQKREKI